MPIGARIIADSFSASPYKRITTVLIRMPWIITPEILRHRVFSFSSASARAIPTAKLIESAVVDPFIPLYWGKNQPGMQAGEEHNQVIRCPDYLIDMTREEAWLYARDRAVEMAKEFSRAGYHKQIVNRLLAPFLHINILITATEWDNFFYLRRHPDAQPEMRAVADAIWEARVLSTPERLRPGQWHTPFVALEDINGIQSPPNGSVAETALMLSAARCARLSYLTHDGRKALVEEDLTLAKKLLDAKHMSPFEHQARPDLVDENTGEYLESEKHGNFVGWVQYRKTIPGENVTQYEGD